MGIISIFLFLVPGFLLAFLYECCMLRRHATYLANNQSTHCFLTDRWYRFLRSLFFNVPMTIGVWIIMWLFKAIISGGVMPANYNQFIDWCMTSAFLLHYVLVLLAEMIAFYVICRFITCKCKAFKCTPSKCVKN